MRRRPPPQEPDDRREQLDRLERAALAGDERALDELHALDVMAGYRVLTQLHRPDRYAR